MKTKMEQFPATNPNPVLSVAVDGTVLYSNVASELLLHEWGVEVGEKLPPYLIDVVNGVTSINALQKIEVKAGNKVYSVAFHPLPEEECVNIYGFDISDQKELEGKLRESEKKYRSIMETTNEGVWVSDATGRTTYANERMAEMLGYSQSEMIGKYGWDFADKEYSAISKQNFENRRHGINETHEFKFIRKDGSLLWALVNSQALADEDGNFTGVLAMFTDITERRRNEEALKKSERRYHLLFDNMLDGYAHCRMLYDDCGHPVDFIYLDTNSAFERLTGLKEVTGKRVTEVIPEIKETHPELFDAYGRVALTGQSERFEIEFKSLGIWLSISVYSTKREHFVAVFDNITERKRAEEALIRERSLLENVMQTTDVMLVFLDPQFNFVWVNSAYAETCHMKPEEIIGMNYFALYPHEENEAIFRKFRDTGNGVFYKDKLFVFPDQPERGVTYWDWSLAPVKDSGGNMMGLVFSLRETTKYKQAEEALYKAYEQIKLQFEEFQKTNEALLESEDRYRELFESGVDGIIITDLAGNILKVNPAYEKMLGYSMEELRHLSYKQLTPARWHESEERIVQEQIFEHGYSDEYEKEYIRKDGSIFPISIRVWLSRDKQGQPRGMLGLIRDITECKQAEEALLESEERFRTMANTIPQLAWIARSDGYIYWYNERWYAYTGTTPEQMEGWGWQSVHDPALLPKVLEQWKASIALGQKFDMEFPLRGADGLYHQFLTRGYPLKDAKGQVIQWFGTNTDITDRKQIEEKLKQSVKQYQTLGDTIPYGVWITDAEGYVTYASDSFLELMDMSMEQVQKFGWMHRLPPEDVQPTTDHWLRCVQTGEDFEREHRFREKDGSYRNVLAIGRPVRNDAGRITEWVGLNLDVTERRKMEEALRESEARFRTLTENSPDIIARFDRQKRHIYANPAAAEPYGHSPEEIVGKTNSELGMSHELVKFWEGHYKNVFLTGKPKTMEFQYISPQGKEYYFNTRIVPEFFKGKATSVLAISRDITNIKEAEAKLKETLDNLENLVKERTEELERAYKSLEDSEQGLAEAQRMAQIGNWDWNVVTNEVYWSNETYRIFGLKPQEFEVNYVGCLKTLPDCTFGS